MIIDEKATMLVDDLMSKQTTQKPIKLKGEKVHKTYCNDVAELAVLSKKHPL